MNKATTSILAILISLTAIEASSWAQAQEPSSEADVSESVPEIPPGYATQPQTPPVAQPTPEAQAKPGTPQVLIEAEAIPEALAIPATPQVLIDAEAIPDPREVTPQRPLDSPEDPFTRFKYPHLLGAPTAFLLPAAVVLGTASVDTGGSAGGSLRIGLGGVGEFGVETSSRIRMRSTALDQPSTIQPLVLATFRMGAEEDLIFDGQPAVVLGFRKSFSRQWNNKDIRVAAIDLVASKTFGKTAIHVGGVFWDASMSDVFDTTAQESVLHDTKVQRQIRPFGGISVEPLENAELLVDIYWVPEFTSQASSLVDAIQLRPTISWGIRYWLTDKVSFESGVRVPDIGEANLLDAQIFGQLSIATDKIRRGLGIK